MNAITEVENQHELDSVFLRSFYYIAKFPRQKCLK